MKKILQTLLVVLCSLQVFAQNVTPPAYADIDTNHRTYVNQVFGTLEGNPMLLNFSINYGFDFSHSMALV